MTMSSDSRHSSSQQSRTHCEKKYPGYVAGCGWVWFANGFWFGFSLASGLVSGMIFGLVFASIMSPGIMGKSTRV